MTIVVVLVAITPAAASGQRCPDVDPADGYRIVARSESADADSSWLTSVARAAAYRWKVPSSRRDLYTGWERVRQRTLPPEPRWADDWTPEPRHRAGIEVIVFNDPRKTRGAISVASGDRAFDRSLESILSDPMPASPLFPRPPAQPCLDSIVVVLTFGDTSRTPLEGAVHFAAVQTRGELVQNTLRVDPPFGHSGPFPRMTVKYDILESGRVDMASIEFVRSAGARFEAAIRNGLQAARFRPPTSNCRAITQTVVQTFGN